MAAAHHDNPHNIRQAILGCIAAAPNGITTTTIITLTTNPNHPPRRIRELLHDYQRANLTTANPPDVWHPTPQLHQHMNTWRPHTPRQPTQQKPPPIHWRTQHAILNDYLHTRRSYRTIAKAHNVTHQQAWDIIHTHLDRDETRVRDNDRNPTHQPRRPRQ